MNEKLIQELREGKCALYVTKEVDKRINDVFQETLNSSHNLGGWSGYFYYVIDGSVRWSTSTNLPKYNIEDFLKEEWKPKRGEPVLVRDNDNEVWNERVFIAEIEGAYNCFLVACIGEESKFKNGEKFYLSSFNRMKRLEKPETIEITIEEIAKMKGVKPDQIRIKE